MHWLDRCSKICIVGIYLSGTLESERMGDNLKLSDEVLDLFCCFVYSIITLVIFMNERLC
jgi:hypothetical protein